MSMGRKRQGEFLNGELCANLWAELGSLAKVSLALEKRGIINTATGKRATPMGVRVAAGKWMCMNPIKAREMLSKVPGNDWVLNDSKFEEYLVRMGVNSLGKKNFRQFLNKYQLHEIYEKVRVDKKTALEEDASEEEKELFGEEG